jgi:endonuclease YncB( thermonuclease family)
MKRIVKVSIVTVFVSLIGYFFLLVFLPPSGVWFRKVVRDHPLKTPTAITSVRGDTLISARQEFRLAGVTLPADPKFASGAADFLRVASAQGVEVIRLVQPSGRFLLRCEPRVWHWCGNDPVKDHYEQFNLSELLVAFGYATVDDTATGLTDHERLRLQAAQKLAKERPRGMWTERPNSRDRSFRPELGLNISDAHGLQAAIDYVAGEMAEQR